MNNNQPFTMTVYISIWIVYFRKLLDHPSSSITALIPLWYILYMTSKELPVVH